jgi:signal peptidase I
MSSDPEQTPLAEPPVATDVNPKPARSGGGWLREILETIIPAVLVALLINLFLAQATWVYGQSMEPTLHTYQRLVIEKISYHLHPPRRGDVVVLKLPEPVTRDMLIKRVVGLPGETIEIRDGKVWINGVALTEKYLAVSTLGSMAARVVPEGTVFVLGDNRGQSNDSRYFGPVALDQIVGHAVFSYWPPGAIGLLH